MKIKKLILPVLMLVMMFGVFIPGGTAEAACSYSIFPNEQECTDNGGTWTPDAAACTATGLGKIICQIHQILGSIVPILLALGMVYFVWGVVQYVIGDEGEAKKKGKDRIIYGIIGFAVIVGVWGLVNILVTTFGLGGTPPLPAVGTATGSCRLGTNPSFQVLLNYATCIINSSIIPLIFALAMVMFVWGVVQYVINSDEEAKKAKGKQFMLWGLIALTVMVSVWGLVGILGNTFGLDTSFIPQVKP